MAIDSSLENFLGDPLGGPKFLQIVGLYNANDGFSQWQSIKAVHARESQLVVAVQFLTLQA